MAATMNCLMTIETRLFVLVMRPSLSFSYRPRGFHRIQVNQSSSILLGRGGDRTMYKERAAERGNR